MCVMVALKSLVAPLSCCLFLFKQQITKCLKQASFALNRLAWDNGIGFSSVSLV